MIKNLPEKAEKQLFVNQSNAISRAMYTCSPVARKLIAMAMLELSKKVKQDKDMRFVSFHVKDFLNSLDITDGSNTRAVIKKAVDECMGLKLILVDNEKQYEVINWFGRTKCDWGWSGNIEMVFNTDLLEIIKSIPGFTHVKLSEMGKIQGKYALRWYEVALSWIGKKGIDGNKPGEWWFKYDVEQIKKMFCLEGSSFARGDIFKTRIIKNPLKELNDANIGFKILAEPKKTGRYITSYTFFCKETVKKQTQKKKFLHDMSIVEQKKAKKQEKEDEKLIKNNIDLYFSFLETAKKQKGFDFDFSDTVQEEMNKAHALIALKKHLNLD